MKKILLTTLVAALLPATLLAQETTAPAATQATTAILPFVRIDRSPITSAMGGAEGTSALYNPAAVPFKGSDVMASYQMWAPGGVKSTNTMSASGKTATVKYKKLKKKAQKVSRASVINMNHAKGAVTYKLASVSKKKFKKYFKISSSGVVTVKKKLKKGTYKVTARVTAAGNDKYAPITKSVTFKIKVK